MSDIQKLGLGQIITTEQQKDAVHMAIAPVTAGHYLLPGDHVSLGSDGEAIASPPFIGAVDPFLTRRVAKGERFWLFLYPGTITGLRHEWSHPAFNGPIAPEISPLTPQEESRIWLEDIASRCGVSYEDMIGCMEEDGYINMGENERYKDVLESIPEGELARHFEIVKGKKPATTYPFSCSC